MVRVCEIKGRITSGEDSGKTVVFGRITLDGTDLLIDILRDDATALMSNVMSDPNLVNENGKLREMNKEEDPVKWFDALPFTWHGTYTWAEMVGPKTAAEVLKGI